MPIQVRTDDQLGWAFLTGALNEVKPDASFMKNLFFPQSRTVPTETIELSYLEGERKLAPFVEVNGEAIAVPGRTHRFANVMAPNIRIKRPMEAYEFLTRRRPGTAIFVGQSEVSAGYSAAIAEDTEVLASMISNRIEQMCAEMISTAAYTYTGSVAEGDRAIQASFSISFPRAAALDVTLTGLDLWADSGGSEGTNSDPRTTFSDAKFQLSKFGRQPTICVMGRDAAQAFMVHTKVQTQLENTRDIAFGRLTEETNFTDQGALFLGSYMGIDCWEYSRTYEDQAETPAEQYFLDPDTVVFGTPEAQRDNVLYYGAIPDHDAIEGGLLVTERFSKSWVTKDPSVRVQLAHSRPLPCLRRPNTVYAAVVAG